VATHRISQNHWHNVLGTRDPVLAIDSGDTIVVRTIDAAGGDEHGNAALARVPTR
jgi:acetamidase/formamidase